MDINLLLAFLGGVGILLLLILFFRLNAFLSLLISSICVGLFTGMPFDRIIENVISGMGGTLGFVAAIIGLGAIFGAILEHSGATEKLANTLLEKFGTENSSTALSLSGFLIAIPVFFDVAFIILIPVIYALQKKTGKSLLFFAIPLLSSLAVTHAFIPPTPGPIAVADIVNADLGWIILFGTIVGLPTTIISGLIFGKYIAKRIHVTVPEIQLETQKRISSKKSPNIGLVFALILLPIVLILANTAGNAAHKAAITEQYSKDYFFNNTTPPQANEQQFELTDEGYKGFLSQKIEDEKSFPLQLTSFLGHPIIALILSTLLALYFLGVRYGATKEELQEVSMKSLGPAGVIILITGAGGVFKKMLVESGAGEMLAQQFIQYNVMPLLAAYVVALLVRLLQGSATVAMLTAAGIMAPIITNLEMSEIQLALLTLSIAAGASGFSHVNDSGFWLVNRYLGLTEVQTLKSWTVMTGILSVTALVLILILNGFFG